MRPFPKLAHARSRLHSVSLDNVYYRFRKIWFSLISNLVSLTPLKQIIPICLIQFLLICVCIFLMETFEKARNRKQTYCAGWKRLYNLFRHALLQYLGSTEPFTDSLNEFVQTIRHIKNISTFFLFYKSFSLI